MTATTLERPAVARRPARSRTRSALRRIASRRWPVESTLLFLVSFTAYMALAEYLVIHLHYMNADAFSRVANATYVLYSRDPHLGAIGFVWPPLPSLLDMPIVALQHWFPFLITRAFAGSVEAAMFGAGIVVLINLGLRRAGVILPIRWAVAAIWMVNPFIAIYATQGMSEVVFAFFVVAAYLMFIRWTDSQHPGQLAVLGLLTGMSALVRIEAVPLVLAMGAAVVFCSVGRGVGWREMETRALLYGLPALLMVGLWLGSSWVIEHDPLFFMHSTYSLGAQASATSEFGFKPVQSWAEAVQFVAQRYFLLSPALVLLAGLVVLRAVLLSNRRPAIALLFLGLPLPVADIYLLHAHQLSQVLRMHVFVLPYTLVLGLYLVSEIRKHSPRVVSVAAILVAALVGVGDLSTFDTISNPALAPEESVAVQAAQQDVTAGKISVLLDPFDSGAAVAQAVDRANRDRGLVAMDTFEGGNVYMTSPDRSFYVVTSDLNFQAVVMQPAVYHVEYFLVPVPDGEGTLDAINHQYPSLWANGGGFATEVAYIGGPAKWKLYRINDYSQSG